MSKVELAVGQFLAGSNCSQAVVETYGPDYGLSEGDCCRVSSAFGGGMRHGEVCGAVSGALMVLGLRYGPRESKDTSKEEVYGKVIEFNARFEAKCGSLICRELLGCDTSTPEGMKEAVDRGVFRSVCPDMVRTAAAILEEL